VQEAYGPDTEIYKTLNPKHSQAQILPMEQRQEQTKNMIREGMGKFGKDLFNYLYDMLELEIQNDTDPKVRQQLVYDICEGNKELMNLCQKLEEIIYWET